ncbi:MAG: S24/S26 family peptidase [Clostridia bacterium]|nr:S24/S26 family peptidase [Clostridia bacterium]
MSEAYEEVVKRNGTLVFTPGGTSMQPLLRHHENPVVLVPVEGRLKKGDVPFYKRENGQYVLHRILKVRKDSYDCCGDNQTELEKGVTDSMIFAKMIGFYRGDTYVSVDDPEILRYSRRRMASRPLRKISARVRYLFHRVFRKNRHE